MKINAKFLSLLVYAVGNGHTVDIEYTNEVKVISSDGNFFVDIKIERGGEIFIFHGLDSYNLTLDQFFICFSPPVKV
ncbi:hypothetical protein JT487_000689 [Salmonella enterica]|nr:hypothetical protein [Salmonella enterica]